MDVQLAPEDWPLEPLAIKMKQYCYLLEDLTADMLKEESGGNYDQLRRFLKERAVEAYWQKVGLLFKPPCLLALEVVSPVGGTACITAAVKRCKSLLVHV